MNDSLRDLLGGRHDLRSGTKRGHEGGHVLVSFHAAEAPLRFRHAQGDPSIMPSPFQRLTLRAMRRSEAI